MEIFINEVSLEGQYFNKTEFEDALTKLIHIFELIDEKIQDRILYREDSDRLVIYEAIRSSNFMTSLNKVNQDARQRFKSRVFNRLNPKEWRKEQLHSPDDWFHYISDENCKDVRDTSLAEVAERKLQNPDNKHLVINFINSSFRVPHPTIKSNCLMIIVKNKDEVNQICLDGIDSKQALEFWLEYNLNLSTLEYALDSTKPPRDVQTILRDSTRFQKTLRKYDGRFIYCELATGYYWYVDNFHHGQAAHLEVFDKTGKNHLGEADLKGEINKSKSDPTKSIDLS